jgi:hypothetical protein
MSFRSDSAHREGLEDELAAYDVIVKLASGLEDQILELYSSDQASVVNELARFVCFLLFSWISIAG